MTKELAFSSNQQKLTQILDQMDQQSASLLPAIQQNITTICTALKEQNITSVEITFEGSGDSGEVESITLQHSDGVLSDAADLKSDSIMFVDQIWNRKCNQYVPQVQKKTLEEGLGQLTCDILQHTHSGWELNDGAYGTIDLTVEGNSLHLDYNERFTEITNSEHIIQGSSDKQS